MPKINYNSDPNKKEELMAGDFLLADDELHMFVSLDKDGPFGLLNMSTGFTIRSIAHPVHAFNHLKKHRGVDFVELIKESRVEITVHPRGWQG